MSDSKIVISPYKYKDKSLGDRRQISLADYEVHIFFCKKLYQKSVERAPGPSQSSSTPKRAN